MAYKTSDRVKEQTTITGTGTYEMDGPITGNQTFLAGVGNGNSCYYTATDGTDWEVGIGTVTDGSPDTLTRDTILASSNADAAVSWSPGTKNIFLTQPAANIAGLSKLYINNVSNAANSTGTVGGVDTQLPLNGDGSNNFSTSTVTTGKVEFDAAFDSGSGGFIVDQLDPQTELLMRITVVNLGSIDTVRVKAFLVFDKTVPGTGVTINSPEFSVANGDEVAVEFSAFHNGIEAVYPVVESTNGRDYQINGMKISAQEITTEV